MQGLLDPQRYTAKASVPQRLSQIRIIQALTDSGYVVLECELQNYEGHGRSLPFQKAGLEIRLKFSTIGEAVSMQH